MQNKNDDWYIHDARTGAVTGPYSEKDAAYAAIRLNMFVHQNGPLGFMDPGGLTGPFYPRPTNERLF